MRHDVYDVGEAVEVGKCKARTLIAFTQFFHNDQPHETPSLISPVCCSLYSITLPLNTNLEFLGDGLSTLHCGFCKM
jgi:hypothetical protein